MKAVKAYPITCRVGGKREFPLPGGAHLLSAGVQDGEVVAYALVDTAKSGAVDQERRRFLTLGAGHAAPPDIDAWHFLGTVRPTDAADVHIFYQ